MPTWAIGNDEVYGPALRDRRGMEQRVVIHSSERGAELQRAQPAYDWVLVSGELTMPLSEWLSIILAVCTASAESSLLQWTKSTVLLSETTAAWQALCMHITDWSPCNVGSFRKRMLSAAALIGEPLMVFRTPSDRSEPNVHEMPSNYVHPVSYTTRLAELEEAVSSAAAGTAALGAAQRARDEFLTLDGNPWNCPEWVHHLSIGPGGLSDPQTNSTAALGFFEYYAGDRCTLVQPRP